MSRKSNTKRKTKKKTRKSRKKKHLTPGAFFTLVIFLLLAFVVYELHLNEQQKKKLQTVVIENVEKQIPAPKNRPETSVGKPKQESQPSPEPTASAGKKKGTGKKSAVTQKTPDIPPIADYTNLAYPISCSAQPEQLIFHTGHTVSYNHKWKIPNWVSYELTADKTVGTESRTNKFVPDPFVKGSTAVDADYRNSGYDRGHMVPAADMKWSSSSMIESFYFSNICPQHPKLNRNRWKDLETKVRDWARSDSAIIVICGPIVNENPERIGSNKVVVPYSFFKVILSPYLSSPKAIGFIFDNAHCTGPLRSHIVTVDSVETVTGIDFFSTLPEHIEDILEAYVDTLYWGL